MAISQKTRLKPPTNRCARFGPYRRHRLRRKDLASTRPQKPLALLKRIVQSSTRDGDTILDPFNGSGTTALACQLIGAREFIGIELKEEYLDLTLKRINDLAKN